MRAIRYVRRAVSVASTSTGAASRAGLKLVLRALAPTVVLIVLLAACAGAEPTTPDAEPSIAATTPPTFGNADAATRQDAEAAEVDASAAVDATAPPISQADCHSVITGTARGAYFRKVQSEPRAELLGMHAVGVLPKVTLDPARWFSTTDPALSYQNGPLDRPSLYFGGRASNVEVDAGLTWDRVYDAQGRATWTDAPDSGSDGGEPARRFVRHPDGSVWSATGVARAAGLAGLRENFAFRPFWRAVGQWHNPPVGSTDNLYLYPGEGFRMQLKAVASGQLELAITHDGAGDRSMLVQLAAPGWGTGAAQSWKRVHSIDQFTVLDGKRVGLETAKLDVIPTHTQLLAMQWTTVDLLKAGGARAGALDCSATVVKGADVVFQNHYADIFRLFEQTESGAETSDVRPLAP